MHNKIQIILTNTATNKIKMHIYLMVGMFQRLYKYTQLHILGYYRTGKFHRDHRCYYYQNMVDLFHTYKYCQHHMCYYYQNMLDWFHTYNNCQHHRCYYYRNSLN